ncbi:MULTISPECIES: beta-galactosidase GalB [unclassified Flavobacterium]|uniref:beta-galactosidase GalB n=1 Tax=unclassified Flavobacterium TaxID=196869 RepID=UPI0025BC5B43|nr:MULTISPECIES: beta-galactosidase GalB [unclassified Flavobacterium]
MNIDLLNSIFFKTKKLGFFIVILFTLSITKGWSQNLKHNSPTGQSFKRERIKLNEDWQFMRYNDNPDNLIYDVRPEIKEVNDSKVADSKPTEAVKVETKEAVLKNWILPSGNEFIKDPSKRHIRPEGDPGSDFPFVKADFQDKTWERVNLPHDWAIKGPFYTGNTPEVGGGMGRLPSQGVAWYRKKLTISTTDQGKIIYLDIDGAMSYAMVWLNGHLVGGWPYGYNSFRLDLTPYLNFGGVNQLAIRVDNPNNSARWYPGGGIYRNVWLTKVAPVHVAQWGTFISTPEVSAKEATINLSLKIENKTNSQQTVEAKTQLYAIDDFGKAKGKPITIFPAETIILNADEKQIKESQIKLKNPKLWGAYPSQKQNLYIARTRIFITGKQVDEYDTPFGIRKIEFNPTQGLLVNGTKIKIQGVNQHHDLGALGAAFNVRAAQRQLEMLRELSCNAIRLSHNPPAPELLDLTDRMGFLVIDEVFDSWERKKTPHDFHLIFPDWYEPDTRSFIRRDRNHPSVIAWSFGNEVGEQYTDADGAVIAQKLHDIVHDEDPTRPASASQNYAKPDMPFSKVMDFMSLNYQGEGIRDAPAYSHLKGIRTLPLYPEFQKAFPYKMIVSSETASTLSTRGSYIFPVTEVNSAPVSNETGGNPITKEVSAYELYTAPFGASPDKVFASQDQHPYVAGEFVWSGWDYLGEPTPYYSARSSYCGIIDLAGFKKDRFYLYQSRWRPNLPMVHILPHWNWPNRVGEITPVHVFTSGDEAELFLNGQSLGRKKKGKFEYRIRWDEVKYQAGELKVIAYKNGKFWAEEVLKTTGKAAKLLATADRSEINSDGEDLAFITVKITDKNGLMVPDANNKVSFSLEGLGEIVATDNGDPASLVSFASHEREAYNGEVLVIVRANKGSKGTMKLVITSDGLENTAINIRSN